MDQWIKIREILEDALDLDASGRSRFISVACAGDAELRREVEQYLRYENAAEHNLSIEKWIREDPAPPAEVCDPDRVGVYRIVRRLGEGGMGIVYLAERDDAEYCQQVALKLLKPGPPSAQLLGLFRRERQILAQLQHPNIACLLDGGTANGNVFYVMEYIEGTPVTEYCQERRLSIAHRLKLFCRICEPVSYAHRKLIIHRDLKPSNILVTADGIPKLLDFGLAKVFQDAMTASRGATVSIGPMLTPAYASPEQVRGEPLGTAADVYSLGVLLYEMLTGQNPQAKADQSTLEVCRTILDEEPKPPSHAAEAGQRGLLSGDLDNIVLMALRKEPERRYDSVDELREDLERYLGGFPVRASRGTAVYRLRKYLGRHRWGIAVSVLSAVLTVGAAATVWWQGRQAEKRFDDVQGLAHAVIFELHDAVRDLPGSTAARKLIVERALEYLGKLDATGAKKRELQLEMAAAYRKIGEVQGGWALAGGNLGDSAGAAKSYGKARSLLQDILRSNAEDPQILKALAEVDEGLSRVELNLNQQDRGRGLSREAIEIRKKLAERTPHSPDAPALVLRDLAEASWAANDWNAAVPAFREALSAYQKLAAQDPGNPAYTRQIVDCHRFLCYCETQRKQWRAALDEARETLRLDSARVKAAPNDRNLQVSMAWDWNGVALNLQLLDDWNAAVLAYKQAIALAREAARADPADSDVTLHQAVWLGDLAEAYDHIGQVRNAAASYGQAIDLFEVQFRRDSGNALIRGLYAYFLAEFADLEARKNTRPGWQAAAAMYQKAQELFAPLGPGLSLDENDMVTKADLPRRLAVCESHLAKTR